jgi:hypothetical protein
MIQNAMRGLGCRSGEWGREWYMLAWRRGMLWYRRAGIPRLGTADRK